jgi:hypothetical protein
VFVRGRGSADDITGNHCSFGEMLMSRFVIERGRGGLYTQCSGREGEGATAARYSSHCSFRRIVREIWDTP